MTAKTMILVTDNQLYHSLEMAAVLYEFRAEFVRN